NVVLLLATIPAYQHFTTRQMTVACGSRSRDSLTRENPDGHFAGVSTAADSTPIVRPLGDGSRSRRLGLAAESRIVRVGRRSQQVERRFRHPPGAASRAEGEASDLSLHVGWAIAHRPVRSQAEAQGIPRPG